jgi:pilus assembly protein CpaB
MQRSSIYMLLVAAVLGIAAVVVAKLFLVPGTTPHANKPVETRPVVVAAAPIAFGEKMTAAKLKIAAWPTASVTAGAFHTIADAMASGNHVALRAVAANEPVTTQALTGQSGRLSASDLLRPTMRAVAIPVSEAGSAAGLLAPGDKVDVYYTRTVRDDEAPVANVLVQNARVLAMGQNTDVSSDQVVVVHTATLEVTPKQALKVVLAQSTGTLSLSLRKLVDDVHVVLADVHVVDLNDGLPAPRAHVAARRRHAPPPPPVVPTTIEVARGMKSTAYTLPLAQ